MDAAKNEYNKNFLRSNILSRYVVCNCCRSFTTLWWNMESSGGIEHLCISCKKKSMFSDRKVLPGTELAVRFDEIG